MASPDQNQGDYVGTSPVQDDNALELFSFDYPGTDNSARFPFGPQISPSPMENLHGYQQNSPSGVVHDLDMVTNDDEHSRFPLNNPVDQDVDMCNDISMLDNEFFSFPSVGVGTISSGSNMLNASQDVNSEPHFENIHETVIANSISANSAEAGNFHMSALGSQRQRNLRQPAEISRPFTNISSEPTLRQSVFPRLYNNQVRAPSQHNSEDKLDRGFLSLGYQGEAVSHVNSHDRKASDHTSNTSFSSPCQMIDSSYNNERDDLAVFKNDTGGPVTPTDFVGNQTLSGDGYYGLQAFKSGFNTSPITNLNEGQLNMQHYMPIPKRSLESGIKTNSIIDLTDPSESSGVESYMLSDISGYDDGFSRSKKRRMQKVKSDHQNAAEPQENSHISTNLLLPPSASGTSGGESCCQDKSGQGAYTVNKELPCGSSAVKRDSLKRIINLPPRATEKNQCRKIMPQYSTQQFSPDPLQNALGQIATGHSAPLVNPSVNAFNRPNALNDFTARGRPGTTPSWPLAEGIIGTSNSARDQQHPTASSTAFVPPFDIPPTCTITKTSPASHANTSTIPLVSVDSPPVSLPVNATPSSLAWSMALRYGSSRYPISATPTKKAMEANISPSAYTQSSAIAPQNSKLLHTSSIMNRPGHTFKKYVPAMAALAKRDLASRASQILGSMPYIKRQGVYTRPTIGFKCMLCNRDLSNTPDGPVVQQSITPIVAVLPCGHTFHDQCLQFITPDDQLKNPPCITCAVED